MRWQSLLRSSGKFIKRRHRLEAGSSKQAAKTLFRKTDDVVEAVQAIVKLPVNGQCVNPRHADEAESPRQECLGKLAQRIERSRQVLEYVIREHEIELRRARNFEETGVPVEGGGRARLDTPGAPPMVSKPVEP